MEDDLQQLLDQAPVPNSQSIKPEVTTKKYNPGITDNEPLSDNYSMESVKMSIINPVTPYRSPSDHLMEGNLVKDLVVRLSVSDNDSQDSDLIPKFR